MVNVFVANAYATQFGIQRVTQLVNVGPARKNVSLPMESTSTKPAQVMEPVSVESVYVRQCCKKILQRFLEGSVKDLL